MNASTLSMLRPGGMIRPSPPSSSSGAGDYVGADMRSAWYNRNLRIFSNIICLPSQPDERILVIIGGGHVPILQHLIENSPEYKLLSVDDYLR